MHLLLLDPTLMCLKQEQATNGGSRTEQPGSGGLLPGVRLLFTNQPEKEKKHRERRERTSAGSLDLESGGPTTVPHRCALCASEHGLGRWVRSCGRRTEPTDLSRKGTRPKNSMKTRSNQNESLPNFAQAITAEEGSYSQEIIAQFELCLRKIQIEAKERKLFPKPKISSRLDSIEFIYRATSAHIIARI